MSGRIAIRNRPHANGVKCWCSGAGGALGMADQWILSRLMEATAEIEGALRQYRFNDAASRLYEFAWHEFCDWYLEMSKIALNAGGPAADTTRRNLTRVLECLMRLMHPFTPFITEEIWQALPRARSGESIVTATYPRSEQNWRNPPVEELMASVEQRMTRLIDIVRAIRNIRAEMNLPPGRPLDAALLVADLETKRSIEGDEPILRTLARVSQLQYLSAGESLRGAATAVVDGVQVFVPLAGLVDLDEEIRRLTREIGKVAGELSGVERKLENPSFRARAPEEIVAEQEEKAAGLAGKKATLERSLRTLEEARAG